MLGLLIHVGSSFGLAYVIGHAKISLPIRMLLHEKNRVLTWLLELIECPACFGFWWGLIDPFRARPVGVHPLAFALFTSGSNFLLSSGTLLI